MSARHIGEVSHEVIASLRERQENPDKYRPIKFGIDRLDEVTAGIVQPSYVTIGGPAGLGKTAFALHIASMLSAANRGKVLFCTLEELEEGMAQRAMSRISIVSRRKMLDLQLTEEDFTELEISADKLDTLNFYVEDEMSEANHVINYAVENDFPFIVIDYLQYLKDKLGKTEVERLAAISRLFVEARNRRNLTTVLVYMMGDYGRAYGTRSVYKDADLGIEFEEAIDSVTEEVLDNKLWANVVKSRQGKKVRQISVGFIGEHSRIVNIPVMNPNDILGEEDDN